MITTIIITSVSFIFVAIGLFIPSNWWLIRPDERGFIMLFGRITNHRGPGPVHAWPWEQVIIRPISQIKGNLVVELTTGGKDADQFLLKIPFVYRIDDVVKSVFAYRGDLNEGLQEFVQASFQEALLTIGGHAILDGSLPNVVEKALANIQDIATKWGLVIDSLKVGDINLSDNLNDKVAKIRKAEGEAEATKIKSEAEVIAYKNEREAQGKDYRFHQTLDAMTQMSANGAFRFVGDFSNMLAGMAVIEEGGIK